MERIQRRVTLDYLTSLSVNLVKMFHWMTDVRIIVYFDKNGKGEPAHNAYCRLSSRLM